MKKIISNLFLSLTLALLMITKAGAVCPICTAAVIAGLGLSRWLKVDDTISGVWIGGLIMAVAMMTINWLEKKELRFWGKNIIVTILCYGLMIFPLYWQKIIGHPQNTMVGVDKLLFGIAWGSFGFLLGAGLYDFLKKKNNDRSHFHFQKVVMPILPLLILTLIFYFLTKH